MTQCGRGCGVIPVEIRSEMARFGALALLRGGFKCPECGQVFPDYDDYAYGHDCEAE